MFPLFKAVAPVVVTAVAARVPVKEAVVRADCAVVGFNPVIVGTVPDVGAVNE